MLPNNLKFLEIRSDIDLQNLPINMDTLYLEQKLNLSNLPENLKTLYLGTTQLYTFDELVNLPNKLSSIKLDYI